MVRETLLAVEDPSPVEPEVRVVDEAVRRGQRQRDQVGRGIEPVSGRPTASAKRVTDSAVSTTGSVVGKDRPTYEALSMYRGGED
nr:hypothetical protein GCM10025732_01160 [Glycomyces mayteni]